MDNKELLTMLGFELKNSNPNTEIYEAEIGNAVYVYRRWPDNDNPVFELKRNDKTLLEVRDETAMMFILNRFAEELRDIQVQSLVDLYLSDLFPDNDDD